MGRLGRSIEKLRDWQRRSKPLQDGKPLERHTRLGRKSRIKARNHKRMKRLRADQFGADGYYEHVVASPCLLTGRPGPNDPAHILKSRGAGGGPEHMGPLCREAHTDFDHMPEDRFLARHGRTKEWVRDRCREFRIEWTERKGAA